MQKHTEQSILDNARKHFIQKGYAATRTQDIADDAGINKAMLHYYFRSKEKLYQEVISYTLAEVLPRIASAMTAQGTFFERIEHLVSTYVETIIDHPEMPLFVMYELSQKREGFIIEMKKHAAFFPAIQSFFEQMNKEVEAGKIRDIPPIHLILNILGMTVFPFMAKPVISNIFDVPDEQFEILMKERKEIIIDFITNSLKLD